MKKFVSVIVAMAMGCGVAIAQGGDAKKADDKPAAPPQIAVGSTVEPAMVYERGVSGLEKEFMSLAEAIPADKWDYVPTQGDHKGVQSLGDMMRHVAQANMMYYGAVIGQRPSQDDMKKWDEVKGKDAVLAMLKQSFQMGHQAAASMTAQNAFQAVQAPFGSNGASRVGLITQGIAHGFDHYGHLTEYARDLGIVPPSSRKP
ncbi:MAG: hypothetical protein NVS9B15_12320 [Acidobacteriaceae bacterium]